MTKDGYEALTAVPCRAVPCSSSQHQHGRDSRHGGQRSDTRQRHWRRVGVAAGYRVMLVGRGVRTGSRNTKARATAVEEHWEPRRWDEAGRGSMAGSERSEREGAGWLREKRGRRVGGEEGWRGDEAFLAIDSRGHGAGGLDSARAFSGPVMILQHDCSSPLHSAIVGLYRQRSR